MASNRLTIPNIHELDPDQVIVRYDELSDTLFVHFYGTGIPGVSVQVEENIFLRLDEAEQHVVGVQIEAFLRSATIRRPELLPLTQLADIPNELLREWRQRADTGAARLDLINSVIHDWTMSNNP